MRPRDMPAAKVKVLPWYYVRRRRASRRHAKRMAIIRSVRDG